MANAGSHCLCPPTSLRLAEAGHLLAGCNGFAFLEQFTGAKRLLKLCLNRAASLFILVLWLNDILRCPCAPPNHILRARRVQDTCSTLLQLLHCAHSTFLQV